MSSPKFQKTWATVLGVISSGVISENLDSAKLYKRWFRLPMHPCRPAVNDIYVGRVCSLNGNLINSNVTCMFSIYDEVAVANFEWKRNKFCWERCDC